MRRLLAALLPMAALVLVSAPAASAHSGLRDGSPGPGDEVAPGARTVALVFEAVDPDGAHTIALLDADDEPLPIGAARVVGGSLVCASVEPMTAGVHAVEYSVTSEDGHLVRGRYLFEVAEGGAEPPELGCASAQLPAPEAGEALGYAPSDIPAWVLWTLGGLVVVSGAGAGVAVARSRRGPGPG